MAPNLSLVTGVRETWRQVPESLAAMPRSEYNAALNPATLSHNPSDDMRAGGLARGHRPQWGDVGEMFTRAGSGL
jgi:hypothetical protein